MRKLISIISLICLIGCSNLVSNDQDCLTIGAIDNVTISHNDNEIVVYDYKSVTNAPVFYFYLDNYNGDNYNIIKIPDSSIIIDGYYYTNLSVYISDDVTGHWYMQIINNDGGNLIKKVGSTIEIRSFTIKY